MGLSRLAGKTVQASGDIATIEETNFRLRENSHSQKNYFIAVGNGFQIMDDAVSISLRANSLRKSMNTSALLTIILPCRMRL